MAAIYERLAPASLDVKVGERLVQIDRHRAEYLLFQTFWTLFKSIFPYEGRRLIGAIDVSLLLDAWEALPAAVLRPERRRRQYLSGLLARNGASFDATDSRALFLRLQQGWYQLNPTLEVRVRTATDDQWQSVLTRLNLPLVRELAIAWAWPLLDALLRRAGMPIPPVPVVAEHEVARIKAEEDARAKRKNTT